MDQHTRKTPMDPHDQSIPIEKVSGQEKKWMDAVKLASVTVKDKDPVSASNVAWLIYNGYVPRIRDDSYQKGRLELQQTLSKGDFYQSTDHWEMLGLTRYNALHTYCSLRGDDLENDLPS